MQILLFMLSSKLNVKSRSNIPKRFNEFVNRMMIISLERKSRLEKTNYMKLIAVSSGFNSTFVDKLIKKISLKVNNKSKLVSLHKKDRKFMSTLYTNVLSAIIETELKT